MHDGLDVDIRAGEVFGIVGGSGSGKSVLLRTMLGLQKPASGSVKIEGQEVTTQSERELLAVKRRYGVMFQRGALFSSLTVAQNVELPIVSTSPGRRMRCCANSRCSGSAWSGCRRRPPASSRRSFPAA